MKRKSKIIANILVGGFVIEGSFFINTNYAYASEIKKFELNNSSIVFYSDNDKVQEENNASVSRGSYDKGIEVVNYACKFLGKPYVYGATGPNSFDCSGLTQYVYRKFGTELTRTTYTQGKQGVRVDRKNLKAGDLVFFNTQGSLSHVGIYMGNGKFIHAPRSGKPVMISSLADGYYSQRFETARRIFT